ncbi:hypothetical protein IMAU80162_00992 [Lactiplantibacillus plantarum]|nr:hypothetical protein [Lactiplantibacillus plantarum]MCG0864857.1 hypothetical protein [Lactiplantibacillus plantarum]
MDKLNQEEKATLDRLIGIQLDLAHWLFTILVSSGLLWLASLLPILSGQFISILLDLTLWACILLAGFIIAGNILAYYYVLDCERNNLDRFIKQAKKESGK